MSAVAARLERVNIQANTADVVPALERLRLGANYVPGQGSLSPKVVLIGEAPGRTENLRREPFCGPSGRVLNDWLWGAGLTRNLVYITNLVKWWPNETNVGMRGERKSTRPPSEREKEAALPYLLQELAALGARNVILLGKHASGAFLHKGHERARWYDTDYVFRACAVYHPATVLYQSSTKQVRIDEFARVIREM